VKRKLKCEHGCEFVQITDRLWLCKHTSYGDAGYNPHAVAEGRRMLEAAGGYEVALARQQADPDWEQERLW